MKSVHLVMHRTLRTLGALKGASTSRVLNLASVAIAESHNPGHRSAPFFSSSVLNSAILLKHRLRPREHEAFSERRAVATKVIIPFSIEDLRMGGQSFFVGQRSYGDVLRRLGLYAGQELMRRDIGILELVDAVPSLDPFLLREHLRDHKITPDQCYFAISDADQRRMFEFASKEVQRLTDLALGEQAAHQMSDRMVSAMLSGTVNGPLDPLRTTLDLAPAQFAEGVFGWRGFLYYKWKLQGFWTDVIDVLKQVHTVRPVGTFGADTADRIACIKRVLVNGVKAESAHVHEVIGIYDAAYSGLVESHDPREFRGFLLEAPALLPGIGETIGAISHFTSFWHSRFPAASPGSIDAFELMVILQDFADSLGIPIEQDRRQLRRH